MTELRDNIFAIECPQTLAALNLYGDAKGTSEIRALDWKIVNGLPKTKQWNYFLPNGNWEIVCQSNAVTEPQAADISPGKWSKYFENAPGPLFMDYRDNIYRFDNAIKSLQSLLKSKGLSAENYLIIKKVV